MAMGCVLCDVRNKPLSRIKLI